MKEYIEKWPVVNRLIDLENEFQQYKPFHGFEHAMYRKICEAEIAIGKTDAADVVGLDVVAEMLYVSCGCDECPCNYGPTDEWLPEVCDLKDECPKPKDKLGCWKQYIKHFAERPEYLRGAYEREADHD